MVDYWYRLEDGQIWAGQTPAVLIVVYDENDQVRALTSPSKRGLELMTAALSMSAVNMAALCPETTVEQIVNAIARQAILVAGTATSESARTDR